MDILMGSSANWQRSQNPNHRALVAAFHTYVLRAIQECSRQIYHGVNASNPEGLLLAPVLYDILRKEKECCSKMGEP
jgi:hypothetical protein